MDPLCIGGATPSSVMISEVGTMKRYDWTCSVAELSGPISCSSGATSFRGEPTASCGFANGVPSATAPGVGLCGPSAQLTREGVVQMIDATNGQPLWNWSCIVINGNRTVTSCYAPNTSGGSGHCRGGFINWDEAGKTCSGSYAGIANGQTGRACVAGLLSGCVDLLCTNTNVSITGSPTCK